MSKEIEARELRIGNYIYLNSDKDIDIVDTISKDEFGDLYINRHYGINEIKPIPLTKEILLECGFKFDRKKNYFYISFNDISQYIEIYENADDTDNLFVAYLTNDDIETENSNPIFLLYINNLHQLQNLHFALTNEELEINL